MPIQFRWHFNRKLVFRFFLLCNALNTVLWIKFTIRLNFSAAFFFSLFIYRPSQYICKRMEIVSPFQLSESLFFFTTQLNCSLNWNLIKVENVFGCNMVEYSMESFQRQRHVCMYVLVALHTNNNLIHNHKSRTIGQQNTLCEEKKPGIKCVLYTCIEKNKA